MKTKIMYKSIISGNLFSEKEIKKRAQEHFVSHIGNKDFKKFFQEHKAWFEKIRVPYTTNKG